VTEVVRREIFAATSALPVPVKGAAIVLACPEDERHDLGLAVLALLLRRRSVRVLYLGADVPAADLLASITDTGASAVCLSATLPSSIGSMSRATRRLISARAVAHIFVGGPALESESEVQVAGIRLPQSLDAAADFLANTLGDLSKEAFK
jgi:methanogenic corrinoid protein MtbC1